MPARTRQPPRAIRPIHRERNSASHGVLWSCPMFCGVETLPHSMQKWTPIIGQCDKCTLPPLVPNAWPSWCGATCARCAPTCSRRTSRRCGRMSRRTGRGVSARHPRGGGDRWCTRTMRSRLDPMKKVARMVRSHRELLLNWFRARGAVQRHCGGLQRQGESDHQKSVRVSHLRCVGNRVVSYTWRPARA